MNRSRTVSPPRTARVRVAMHCERPPGQSERLTETEIERILAAATPATSACRAPAAEEDPFELDASYGRLMAAPCGERVCSGRGFGHADVDPPSGPVSLATLLVLCTPLPHILQLPSAMERMLATGFHTPEEDVPPLHSRTRRCSRTPALFPPPRTKPSAPDRQGARPRQSWRRSTPN
jgi:hypothetical protein